MSLTLFEATFSFEGLQPPQAHAWLRPCEMPSTVIYTDRIAMSSSPKLHQTSFVHWYWHWQRHGHCDPRTYISRPFSMPEYAKAHL